MPNTPIVPPRVPFTDPRTGVISREWYRFLMNQASVTGGAALTHTNDSNVTLTLGGSPSSSLLAPVSLMLGWTGHLPISRGGTGAGTAADALAALGGATPAYVDGQDAITLSAAKAYADTVGAAANAYTDAAVAGITGSSFSVNDIVTVPDGDTFALVFTDAGDVVAIG